MTNMNIVNNQIFNDKTLMFLFTFMYVKYNNFTIIKLNKCRPKIKKN